MNSVGRIQQALAAATNDVTVAAANFNFDFTLVKCEPPEEYRPLGTLLSAKRKHNAEFGPSHVTARRLGALFEDVCPDTPRLIQAYGTRASEIARLAGDKVSSLYAESIFAAHTGVDATSIWAAATSSKAALPIYLLACMLARHWSSEEATSIWMELIKERREDIARKFEAGELISFPLVTAAAQQEIPRQQIAEWDASARAWIQTADSVKEYQQTQLLQILKNIRLPINSSQQLYTNVTGVWVSALDVVEKLISGMPQAVNDGACFLALASWHLYPDLTVFGGKNVEVRMSDPLFASSGVLSLGLMSSSTDSPGIYWSLSLAHLRYYGAPVYAERVLDADQSRITFPQVFQVTLGCLFKIWRIPPEKNREAARFVVVFSQFVLTQLHERWEDLGEAASKLGEAASNFLSATGEDAETSARLILLGRKRAHRFWGLEEGPGDPCPTAHRSEKFVEKSCFGLLDLHRLLKCMKDTESRLQLLRRLAGKVSSVQTQDILLKYVRRKGDDDERKRPSQQTDRTSSPFKEEVHQPKRRKVDQLVGAWTDTGYTTVSKSCFVCRSSTGEHCYCESRFDPALVESQKHVDVLRKYPPGFWAEPHPASPSCPKIFLEDAGTLLQIYTGEPAGPMTQLLQFKLVMGIQDLAAIMVTEGEPLQNWLRNSPELTIDDLLWCFENDLICDQSLDGHLEWLRSRSVGHFSILSFASKFYDSWGDTNISVGVFDRPLVETKWAQEVLPLLSYGSESFLNQLRKPGSRGFMFSAIIYFRSGFLDVEPRKLEKAIAISSGDSLFITKALVCDPSRYCEPWEIQRVLGNVGKPGITVLIPPQDTLVKDADSSKWRTWVVTQFDGRPENYFGRTSLHLWFTGYYAPIHHKNTGLYDSQIFFLESVISVRDAGEWVADIDVLSALNSCKVQKLPLPLQCTCTESTPQNATLVLPVQSWDSVLDYPDSSFVVQAHGNWVARLATTCVLAQVLQIRNSERCVMICPPSGCWRCIDLPNSQNGYIF